MSRVSRPCHSCGNSRLEHQAGSPCLDSSCHRAFGGYTVRWETACLQLSLSRKMKINKLKFKNKCSLTSVTLFPLVSLSSLLTAPSLLSGLSPRASQKGYLALTCSGTDLISGETSEVSVELSPSSSWTTLAAHQVGWPQWALSHLVLSQVTFPFNLHSEKLFQMLGYQFSLEWKQMCWVWLLPSSSRTVSNAFWNFLPEWCFIISHGMTEGAFASQIRAPGLGSLFSFWLGMPVQRQPAVAHILEPRHPQWRPSCWFPGSCLQAWHSSDCCRNLKSETVDGKSVPITVSSWRLIYLFKRERNRKMASDRFFICCFTP